MRRRCVRLTRSAPSRNFCSPEHTPPSRPDGTAAGGITINIDLHSHSSQSDGLLSPDEVATRAHANGVDMWALSDHDELSGLAQAAESAARLGMRFVPGVEVSVTFCAATVHVLGLNIDATHPDLVQGLATVRRSRFARARDIADHLQACGLGDCYEGALALAQNPGLISRAHFARYLHEQGRVRSMQQAFDRYLGEGKPAYAPVQWASLEQAVGWIKAAGGKAVIAHPGRYRYSPLQFDALFEQFKALGGHGVEVVSGCHTPRQYEEFGRVAMHYGFEASRGSDFHSPMRGRPDLGTLPDLPDRLTPVWHDWV